MDDLQPVKDDWKRRGLDWDYWVKNPNDERAALEGCYPRPELGHHAVAFAAKYCRHSKGEWAGQPFILADWQVNDIIMPLFSWVRIVKGKERRRFKKAEIWLPKKNGKSVLCSFIALYLLRGDNEPGAEIYCAAVDKKQAGIVFGEAANMVEASEGLAAKLEVIPSVKTIKNGSASWFRALSADAPSVEGLNAHGVIVDELHAHRTRDLFKRLVFSGRARRNFMFIVISTAGEDRETIGGEEYELAKAVLNGSAVDIRTFAYVREALPTDDWTDEKIWAKANPGLGTIIDVEDMRGDCRDAQNEPRKQADFKRYQLNLWVETSEPEFDMNRWDSQREPVVEDELVGQLCCGGLDLSTTTDLTAFVLDFPDGDKHRLLCHFWLPEDDISERERSDGVLYRQWADAGYLTLTPGPKIDYEIIYDTIVAASKRFDVQDIAYDRAYSHWLVKALTEKNGITMTAMGQGWISLSQPCKDFKADIAARNIIHGSNPILRWMAAHTVIKKDDKDNWHFDKKKSRKRIDGIVAATMACSRARLHAGSSGQLCVAL